MDKSHWAQPRTFFLTKIKALVRFAGDTAPEDVKRTFFSLTGNGPLALVDHFHCGHFARVLKPPLAGVFFVPHGLNFCAQRLRRTLTALVRRTASLYHPGHTRRGTRSFMALLSVFSTLFPWLSLLESLQAKLETVRSSDLRVRCFALRVAVLR